MSAIEIGPLVLSLPRFAAVAGLGAFLVAAEALARLSGDRRLAAWSGPIALAGAAGARLGHVLQNWESFAADPLRVFAVWQGGFSPLGAAIAVTAAAALAVIRGTRLVPLVAALWAGVVVWQAILLDLRDTEEMALPPLVLPAPDGPPVDLAALAEDDRPVVLNLWATWCPPCRREMPLLIETARRRDDVTVVLVNQGESAAQVRAYLAAEGLAADDVALDQREALAAHYGTVGLPATLFIGADGLLRHTHLGEISPEILVRRLDRLTTAR
ncbi:TlpA family protein disulfide reductase [Rhodosalinus sediminis]|uniref:TlpA family protein disulfide reductase n=1 Tax=Rhodosalinus sediminis TaxID=1940533 RepID=A0A3D9BSQ5_9RHOB|nr:TlpA disulfide reductase family protein [Rhodosalinus sediminis]REC56528.1 TlpA family protein disulfide reductase [Rhodosalinus sediminis]